MGISERELEDCICKYPEVLSPDLEIIDRQVALPHGRLDILGFDYGGYGLGRAVVIELKAKPLRPRDVAQVLRYRYDVWQIIKSYVMDMMPVAWNSLGTHEEMPAEGEYYERFGTAYFGYYTVHAWVVGTKYDDSVLACAWGAGVDVGALRRHSGGLGCCWAENEMEEGDPHYTDWCGARDEWSDGLQQQIQEIAWQRATEEYDRQIQKLFGGNA